MCVKCRYKALILARKSVQPFIISSHLNSFSFRLFFFFLAYVPSLLRDIKSVRRIKRSLGWEELVWWVKRWTNLKKGEKYICQLWSLVSWGSQCLCHSLSCCQLLSECYVFAHRHRNTCNVHCAGRENFTCKLHIITASQNWLCFFFL